MELHPLLAQKALLEYCKSEGIHLTAYSPLGSRDRAKAMKAEDEPNMFEIEVLKEIAKKHNALVPQILIAFHTKRDCAVIPKSTTKEHIITNFQSAAIALTDSDMEKIDKLDRHYRFLTGKFFDEPSKGYENIYDE